MPYLGRGLEKGNYLKLDDISSQFDGSKTTFNLTVGGSAHVPGSSYSLLVSLSGIVQEGEAAYTLDQNEITFAAAPQAADDCFIISLGTPLGIGVPSNGTVNGTQLAKPLNYDNFFHLDHTNDRVGIGTSLPTQSLDVYDGNIAIRDPATASQFLGFYHNRNVLKASIDKTGNNLTFENVDSGIIDYKIGGSSRVSIGSTGKIFFGTDDNTYFYRPGADTLGFLTGGTERLRILSSGNIGIGTDVAPHKLSVKGTISKISGANGAQIVNISNDASNNGHIIINDQHGVTRTKLDSADVSYIRGGNLGIGITNPGYRLEIGNILLNNQIKIGSRITGQNFGIAFGYYDNLGGDHGFGIDIKHGGTITYNAFVVRANTGSVGIGTSDPTALLHAQNNSATDTKIIIESTGTNSYPAFRVKNDARAYDLGIDGATDAFRIYDVTGTAERLRIDSNGYIGINDNDSTVGLSINKFGTQPVTNGNTYPYPAGNWSTVWNTGTANSTDYWCGFVGGYNVSSATVNICLQPNTFNFSTQQGMYIAGEATTTSTADFTIGRLIGGSVGGASTVAGTKRATKDEFFRITSDGEVGIGTDNPQTILHLHDSASTRIQITDNAMGAASGDGVILGLNGDDDFFINNRESSKGIKFFTGSDDLRLHILSDGDVGIGTDTVHNNARLQVSTHQQVVAMFEGTGVSDPQIYVGDNMSSPTDNCIILGYDKADNRGYLTVGGDGDDVFTVTNGGNIGIGLTSPSTKLGIKVAPLNTATITTTNCLQLGLSLTADGAGSNTEGHIYNGLAVGDGYAGLYGKDGGSSAATDLEFFTGTASAVAGRMRIQDDGKIIIGGDVSQSINRSISVLAASGNSQSAEIGLQPTNASGGYNPEVHISSAADGDYGARMGFHTRNTSGDRAERFGIASSGNIRWRNGAVLQRKTSAFLGISGAGTSDVKISGNFENNDMLRVRWAYNWNAGDGGAWGEAIIWKMYEGTKKVRYLTDVKATPLTSVSFPHSGNDIWLRWQTDAGINGYYMIDVETAGCEPFPF